MRRLFLLSLFVCFTAHGGGWCSQAMGRMVAELAILALKARYEIKTVGVEPIRADTEGGVLYLANHPAYAVDSLILMDLLFRDKKIRPIITESEFYAYQTIIEISRPILVPTTRGLRERVRSEGTGPRGETAANRWIFEASDALKNGDNVLLFPGAELQKEPLGLIRDRSQGAPRGLTDLLNQNSHRRVIGVYLDGLYGSSFSYGFSERYPTHNRPVRMAAATLLGNYARFRSPPTHSVQVTFEDITGDFSIPTDNRQEINEVFNNFIRRHALPIDGRVPRF